MKQSYKCPECDGTGKINDNSTISGHECRGCKGTGLIECEVRR